MSDRAHQLLGKQIPVYVVEGFLESGKTRLLNYWIPCLYQTLATRRNPEPRLLYFAAEQGFSELSVEAASCLESSRECSDPRQCTAEFWSRWIHEEEPDAIVVEWNGTWDLLILTEALAPLPVQIQPLVWVQRAERLVQESTQQGSRTLEWMSRAQNLVLTGAISPSLMRQTKRLLTHLGAPRGSRRPIFWSNLEEAPTRLNQLAQREVPVVLRLGIFAAGLWVLYLFRALLQLPTQQHLRQWVEGVSTNVLSLLFQIFPFLLLATLVSSAIQLWVSEETWTRLLRRRGVLRYPLALGLGFCLPLCDCGLLPIATRLVRKGTPLPLTILFFVSASVTNPLVLASTWFAFPGQPRVWILRLLLGWMVAGVLALILSHLPKAAQACVQEELQLLVCSSGYLGPLPRASRLRPVVAWLRHTWSEFLSLGRYVILGALLSAIVHTSIPVARLSGEGLGGILSWLALLLTCLFLAVCSNSNAFLARSLAGLLTPVGTLLYLVFSPLLDLKNLLVMGAGFGWKLTRFYVLLVVGLLLVLFVLGQVLPASWFPASQLVLGGG